MPEPEQAEVYAELQAIFAGLIQIKEAKLLTLLNKGSDLGELQTRWMGRRKKRKDAPVGNRSAMKKKQRK